MALLFMDGFDTYNAMASFAGHGWTFPGSSNAISFPAGRFGGNAINLYSAWQQWSQIKTPLSTLPSTVIVGTAFYSSKGLPTAVDFARFTDGGSTQMSITWDTSTWQLRVNNGTTTWPTTYTYTAGSWVYIEWKIVFGTGVSGSTSVRVNGIQVLNQASINTAPSGSARTDGYMLFQLTGAEGSNFTIDDLYICDGTGATNNTFLGDIRVQYLVPTGAGVKTQFTPSTGSNWQTVDEVPASDTDYNSANSPGAMDLFQMANLAGNGLVYGVQTISRSKKDDAGFRKAAPVFYKASGLGETARFYKGSQAPVIDNFLNLPLQMFNTSPDTGVAWTVDEVNALQYGYAVGDAGMFTIDARLV